MHNWTKFYTQVYKQWKHYTITQAYTQSELLPILAAFSFLPVIPLAPYGWNINIEKLVRLMYTLSPAAVDDGTASVLPTVRCLPVLLPLAARFRDGGVVARCPKQTELMRERVIHHYKATI